MNGWVVRQLTNSVIRCQERQDYLRSELARLQEDIDSMKAMLDQEDPPQCMQREPDPEVLGRRYHHPDPCPICERQKKQAELHRIECDAKRHPLDMRDSS